MIGASVMPKHLRWNTILVVALAVLLVTGSHLLAQRQQGQGQRGQRPNTSEAPPSEVPPEAAPDAKPASPEVKPDESYTMLVTPAIAARMGLTDQQIAQVASLMVERSQKLSSTEEDQWNAIRAENEEKLKAVLTEEQQANWLKVIHEKTLIIIFDKAAWAEVLTWFADRLGLQLIMETPPPGTFTFSDRTEYSPAEALDMLNSVLQARGYTLVRYENLLHLFNLTRTKQIPAVYLPKLQPADLDNRKAKFEFVAVTYALSRRNREAVDAQIKQYLGPNSYVIDLPGNSFMLIDTVASHRLINKVIYAMADPAAPEQQQRPPQAPGELPPLPTDWDTYTILKNDPAKVEEIVREYGGISSMVRLPNSPQIHVLANDDQHRNVRSIIDRLDVDPGTTMMPTVQIYSLDQLADAPPERLYMMYRMWGSLANLYDVNETFVKKFLEMLEKIVPNAVTTYESNNRKLVVLAVPDDQAKISELIEKLKRTFTDEDAPVIKVYKLKGSVSLIENVVENVQKLVPKAMVEFNRGDRYLLVVGSADEHKMITAAIEEVESVSDDGIERKMVCYPVNRMLSNRWNMLWRDLRRMPEFEGVLELSEGRDNQLTIWATAEQHVRMRQVLDELTGGGEAIGGANDADEGEGTTTGTSDRGRANELIAKAFVVRRGNVNSLQWVLPQVIPGISVYPEPESSTILVYGTRKALDSVEDFIFKVDEEFGFGVLVLPLDTRPTDDFMTTMRMTFRRFGNVTFDPKNMRLIAYGPKSELAQIEKIMAELKRTTPEEPKTMMTLPVKQDLPDHLVEFVRDAVPRAEIQYDKESKLVSVAGTKTEQLLASKVILEVEASLPPPERVRLFPVGRLITDDFINTVKTNVDYIREVKRDDLDPMSLYVKARPAVLDEVERLLDDLQDQFKLKPSSLLVVYSVTQAERSRFDSVQSELKKEIGEFRILNDDRRNVMPVWALPLQHERIGEMLESLKTVAPLVMPEKFITYSPRFTENATLQQLVKDIYPDVNITEDSANNRLILRVPTQIAESVDSLLKQIDTADPNRVKRYFASYPVGRVNILDPLSGSYFSWYDMLQQLQPLAPNAKLTYDTISQSIFVWGTAEEHEIIKETIENIHNTEPADRFGRFPIHRADPSEVIYFVQGMLPNLQFMYDPTGKTLIVQSRNAEQRKLVAALIEKLDPEDPGPNDPQIRFYQLSDMPSDQVINTLQWLTHEAYIVPDAVNRQLMVVARPAEHELIRKNVDLIVSTFTPDEPVLFLYTVTDDQRKRIESFVQTATEEMAGLSIRIVDDTSPGQMSIYARPLGHQLIADALVMMSANTAAGFELDFRIFSLTAVDSETVQKALADRVPEAKLIFDEKGMRMLVWAAKSEMDKVVIIFETLDPTVLKNLKYMTYPVAIGDPETVLDSIKQVYPNIKSQVDERNKRLLIWATPEEHAAIAEMIEATNKDTQVTLQERFRSYPVPKLSPASVKEMIETLFPGVEVYSGGYSLSAYGGVTESARVTVRATAREHKDIETLLEDMQSTDDPYHAEFAVYPMGDADPVTIESLLQGMFPDAESLTSYEIKNLLQDDPMRNMRLQYGGIWFGDMPMNRTQRQIESIRGTRSGCFKVDPGTRSVMVFLPEDDQKKIASLIDDITKIAKISGKMTVRRYELEEGYIYRYIPMLQEIVPTAKITGSYGSEIVVFATEEDHKLIQKCIDEIDALGKPGSQRVYQVITIPDGSGIPRDLLVQQIWSNFSGYAQNGPLPNQIVYNGYQKEIPKIEKLIEDMAAEQLEKSNALPKVYTLKYISVTNAKKWLQATVPNAQFEAPTQIFRPFYNPYYNDPYQSTLQTSDDPTARTLVIRATPLDHKLIAEALEVLDVDLPEEIRPVPRDYEFVLYPPSMMTWSWYALREAFPPPQATFVMNSERIAILAVASPKTHEEIKKFIDNFVQQKMEELPVLEVYAMKNFPALRAMQLIRQMQTYSSRITMFQGATPEQIIVYARPVDQAKVVEFIAKLESITVPENMMMLKAYQVPPDALIFTQNALRSQIVGGIVYTLDSTATSAIAPLWMPGGPTQYRANLANSTIIVYGTEADHALAEKLTESMGESFPEPVTKTYFTKNIPIGEAFIFLNRQFAGRAAAIYVRQDTGDMIVSATPPLHEEIQKTIDAIDVPRPPESEKIVVVHD
ncbi:MAG: hypothetical protein FWH27_03255 [Planctomycetaceae bacterium]|nr:hypothetical protein [Planctomycetaceae bacterium]